MKARAGDTRPLVRGPGVRLVFLPSRPFRWLPRHGHPICVGEWFTQNTVKTFARPTVYFAAAALLVALIVVFGLPFTEGG